MTQRDIYTDGLARRTHPPDTYQGALERVQRRGVGTVARMPTAYEREAYTAARARRAAMIGIVELVGMFVAGFIVGYLAFR